MCLSNFDLNCYIDNVLTETEKLLFEEHFFSCVSCRNKLNFYKTSIKTVNGMEPFDIPENFVDKLLSKINDEAHFSFEEISGFYDNELNNEVLHHKINKHLKTCEKCQDILNNIRTVSVLSSNTEYKLPESESFLDSLMSKIDLLDTIPCISAEDLSAYLDKEETFIPVEQIENHLEKCAECNNKLLGFKIGRESVLNLGKPILSLDFSRKVVTELETYESKVVFFVPFVRKNIHKATMVAGIIVAGILLTMSNPVFIEQETVKVTIHSEDYLFSSGSDLRKDSFEILAEQKQDDSLQIQDIGL